MISAVFGAKLSEGMNERANRAMRYSPHILLSLTVLLGAATSTLAKPAYVASTVNLRAAPGTTSEVVAKIPGGSLIDADNCTDGWCAVNWQGKSGFAIATALDMSGRVPQQRVARGPRPGPGSGSEVYADEEYVVDDPPVYYGPRPYYYGYSPYYRGGWGWRHRW
jgi:uncharacterized protein YraI